MLHPQWQWAENRDEITHGMTLCHTIQWAGFPYLFCVEYILPTQLPTYNRTYHFSPTNSINGSEFLWPKRPTFYLNGQHSTYPKPAFLIYHQACCNSFVRSIQRGHPSLPNRGSIATNLLSVGCLPRCSYVPTGTVNSTEVRNEDPKFDPHMFLLQTNWEINLSDLRNQLNWQSLLGVKFSYLHVCISYISLQIFNWSKIFVIVSFIVQLWVVVLSSACWGGFITACMGNFLLFFIWS